MSVILKLTVVLIDCLTLTTNFNILYYWSLSKDSLYSIYEIVLLSLFYTTFQSHLSNLLYNYLLTHLLSILLITIYLDVFRVRKSFWFPTITNDINQNSKKKIKIKGEK